MGFDEKDNEVRQTNPKGMPDKIILCYSGLFLALMTLAIFGAQLVVTFVLAFISELGSMNLLESDWFNVALTAICVAGVGLPVFYILMRRIPDSERGEVRNLSLVQFLGYFMVCVGAAYISNLIGMFINSIIGMINGVEVINPLEDFIFNSNMILTILYASIIAPIVEELIFRKILLDKLRRFGDVPAILITGIAFGLFHMNLPQFFYATVLGILFAYITIRTNRIIYAIILHMLLNFVGSGLVPIIVANESLLGMSFVVIWFFGTMTIGSILFILNAKKIVLNKPIVPLVKKKYYILNPGTIIFTIICLVMITISLLGY